MLGCGRFLRLHFPCRASLRRLSRACLLGKQEERVHPMLFSINVPLGDCFCRFLLAYLCVFREMMAREMVWQGQ